MKFRGLWHGLNYVSLYFESSASPSTHNFVETLCRMCGWPRWHVSPCILISTANSLQGVASLWLRLSQALMPSSPSMNNDDMSTPQTWPQPGWCWQPQSSLIVDSHHPYYQPVQWPACPMVVTTTITSVPHLRQLFSGPIEVLQTHFHCRQ